MDLHLPREKDPFALLFKEFADRFEGSPIGPGVVGPHIRFQTQPPHPRAERLLVPLCLGDRPVNAKVPHSLGIPGSQCDTRSHMTSEFTDWRSTIMSSV
jgi:hypothetical protein